MNNKMKRFVRLNILILLYTLLLACDNSIESDNFIDEQISIAGSNWYGHTPVWIGIERGIFARNGFKVKWVYLSSSTDRINDVSADTIQFASVGQISMLKAMAANNSKFYWVGIQDNSPGFEGLVAHKNIQSIADLKGKRIGLPFGTSVEVTLRQLLEKNNLNLGKNKDVELINFNVRDIPTIFRANYVDAALIWEPAFSTLQDISNTKPLATDKDTDFFKRFKSMAGPDVLVMSKTWCDNNPQRAKRFMKAYFESVKWVRNSDNLKQTAELIQGTYIRQPHSEIIRSLKKISWHNASLQKILLSDNKIFTQTDYLLDLLLKYEILQGKRPHFKKWVKYDVLPD